MKISRNRIKEILQFSWPFLVLVLVVAVSWRYMGSHLSGLWENMRGTEGVKEAFVNRDPDAEYDFYFTQERLDPMSADELGLKVEFADPKTFPDGRKVKNASELAEAVGAAPADSVIILEPGKYPVNLEVNKNIYLLGSGADTILSAADMARPVVSVNEAKVSIENMIFENARVGLTVEDGGLTAARLRFDELSATALYARNSTLSANQVWIYDSGAGIKTVGSEGEIKSSIIERCKKSGIELRNSRFNISRNMVKYSQSYGVYADLESEAWVRENNIEGNRGHQVRIEAEREVYR